MGEVAKKEQPLGIVRAEDAPMVAMIERIAMDPSIPIDRLEQMLAMKERMDAKAAEKAFAAAFAGFFFFAAAFAVASLLALLALVTLVLKYVVEQRVRGQTRAAGERAE